MFWGLTRRGKVGYHSLGGATMDSERRIPISQGFYIQLSRDGYALHHGCDESVVLQGVESWLRRNKDHKDFALVEEWLQQKKKQMQEDNLVQNTRAQREAINEMVDKNTRGQRDKIIVEVIREQAFKVRGISPKED
jgi:hypothetical protein